VRTVQGSNDTLNWILGDHLGSTTVTANADGTWNSEIKYTAFGEVRASYGLTPTDYRYTGQLEQTELGLIYFVARFYDPVLTHFVQADTLIPDPGDPLAWDRYAYSLNNPIIYSDPSGHWPELVDYLAGATYQYLDDMSMGAFSDLVVDMDYSDNAAFQEGRGAGRVASTAVASVDQVKGAFVAGAGAAAITGTAGVGAACALATGGVCAVPAAGVVAVEVGMVAAGTASYAYGSGVIAFSKSNSVKGKIGFEFQPKGGFSRDVLTKGYHINSDIGELGFVAKEVDGGFEWSVTYAGTGRAVPGSTAARAVDFLKGNSAVAIERARQIISTFGHDVRYAERVSQAWNIIKALGGE